ncbi:MAG: bifunctional homocysteine S-methyltransferase/methylenetetrahydrofolate reductase [Planctomycetes bacterium]|nr:bifunctional homocysteine S-methyltransferase/methylenetetrahydrofolate reductase [Planctomycetota bacterium]
MPTIQTMPTTQTFPQALGSGVLVFDGAMGTEIYRHHVFTNRCYDELCLSDEKLIRQIHADYRDAGADVLTTNTFAANRVALGSFGLADKMAEINRAGARLAREIADGADRPVYVAGSVGPLPSQPQYEDAIEAMIVEQVENLRQGGADFILFETQPTRAALEKCAAAMIHSPEMPFVLSFAVVDNGETASGEPLARLLAPWAGDVPMPVAWGMNCGTGPDGLLGALEQAVGLTSLPLVVQPNAGIPKEVEGRSIYLCSPEYLTTYAKRYVSLGAAAVGGCCGTTPEHIREMVDAVKPLARAAAETVMIAPAESVEEKPPLAFPQRSRLAWRLAQGQWATSVELLPPRGYDLSGVIARSKTLHLHGVNAINIPDGPRASSRISPLVTAYRIQQEAQIEPILHFCCRDRNLIGMQADLLACAACRIRNILFVTGDPPKLGNYPHATGVFDTDSIGMAAVQRRLNQGIDLGGQAIDPQTYAAIGVGLDPTALDRGVELDRFRRKIEAGAEFAITQPVFDPEALLRFLDDVGDCTIPIMAGIWPLASFRNASFLQNEVPGVEIPETVMQRMSAVTGREDQLAVGVEIARESVERVRSRVAGIQVSAPFGKIETALAVIEG